MAAKQFSSEQQINRLRIYNVVAGSLHLLQAIGFALVLTMLSTQVLFAVTADYLAGPPGVPIPPERVTLFEVNIGIGVVAFLALSAFFHFLVATPQFFGRYKNGLLHNRNYFRWVEYSLSSSIMIWLILAINGVTDIGALFAVFAVNAAMILFGALQEKYEQPGTGRMLPFIFGSMVGIVPVDPHPHLLPPSRQRKRRRRPRLRRRHRDLAVPVLQHFCHQPVVAWQVFSGAIIPAITG